MNRILSGPVGIAFYCLGFALIALAHADAQVQFQVIHSFGAPGDGQALWSSVAVDGSGNVFGTTVGGGAYGYGMVYELSPNGNGGWTETDLYDFGASGQEDGNYPYGPVTLGEGGILYGTTSAGGAHDHGTVYSLAQSGTLWTETILHDFDVRDGVGDPGNNLVLDAAGNLFGQAGTFELSPGSGGWTLTRTCTWRVCSLQVNDNTSIASDDRLFAAGRGGKYNVGDVYAVVPTPNGWQAGDLYDFRSTGGDGQEPGFGPLVADSAGNIYGTTEFGGSHICGNGGCGTIYKLNRQSNGNWQETILYNFQIPSAGTGFYPIAGVILDKGGNLYGTTSNGGDPCSCGVVYRLSPNKSGKWTYTVLHRFIGPDGVLPYSALTFDSHGNLFGTTVGGGQSDGGVVFEISRAAEP